MSVEEFAKISKEMLSMNKDWFFKGEDYICEVRTVAVIIKGNKILVQREKDGTEYALPGGHIKIGETLEDGLLREIKEELGVEIYCKKMLWTEECFFEWNGKKTHNLAFYFLTEVKEGFSIPEGEDFFSQKDNCNVVLGWMPIENLKNITIYPEFLKDEIYNSDEGIRHFISKC